MRTTAGCPRGARCESCGRDGAGLAVTEVPTPVGPLCVTLCPGCRHGVAAGCELPLAIGTAARLVAQHTAHQAGAAAGPVPPSITCPRCGRTSHHPDDVREGYCGACHDFTTAPASAAATSTASRP